MASRALHALLHNFLGTFTSRYTQRDGYWLFGFVVEGPDLDVDLLGPPPEDAAALTTAEAWAVALFRDQLRKARLDPSRIVAAGLRSSASPDEVTREVDGTDRRGRDLRFEAQATAPSGRVAVVACTLFVAPHDPSVERRSGGTMRYPSLGFRC